MKDIQKGQYKINDSWDKILTTAAILIIVLVFLHAYGVFFSPRNLAGYNIANVHRYTARALWEGKLYFPFHFAHGETLDLQFYNGAFFTNWGYGTPLLQLPFYWLRNIFSRPGEFHFFSDRLIFIFYFVVNVVIFFTGLKKLLYKIFAVKNHISAHAWLVFISLFFYIVAFFPYCSLTTRVYEETMCYFLMLQFSTTGFFLHFFTERRGKWLVCAAVTAIFAVTVRPTALIYYVIWFVLFAFCPGKKEKRRKNILLFFLASLPLLLFWITTNYYKSGKWISAGIENAHSYNIEEIANIRFRAPETPGNWLANAGRIYTALFMGNTTIFPMDIKKYIVDKRHLPEGNINIMDDISPPDKTGYYNTLIIEEQGSYSVPFLGHVYPVGMLAVFLFFLIYQRRHWYFFIPFAAFFLMFIGMVYASFTTSLFAFRYSADFWPALILIFIFFIISLEDFIPGLTAGDRRLLAGLLVFSLCWSMYNSFTVHINTQAQNIITKQSVESPDYLTKSFMENQFQKIIRNWHNFEPRNFPSCRQCTDPPSGIRHDRLYWDKAGRIKLISNFFIGVKPKPGKTYVLKLKTDGAFQHPPRVYINNRYYQMQQEDNTFYVKFFLDYKKLITPNVLVTVKWGQSADDYTNKRLLSAFLE